MYIPPENRKPTRIKGVHVLIVIVAIMALCTSLYLFMFVARLFGWLWY